MRVYIKTKTMLGFECICRQHSKNLDTQTSWVLFQIDKDGLFVDKAYMCVPCGETALSPKNIETLLDWLKGKIRV
jgi:hypothetical protein